MKNLVTDKFTVLFRDPAQQHAWVSTSNYDTPQRAVEAAESFRKQNIEAYPVNLRLLVEHVPDFILGQVERSIK
jgi:hypothetical protein